MKVLVVEPGKKPYEADIRRDLSSYQQIVGGLIQIIYPYEDPVALVCNDEGKIIGLPLNRTLRNDESGEIYDVIAGNFFIAGLSDEDLADLTPELMAKYKMMFWSPERFRRYNGTIVVNRETLS